MGKKKRRSNYKGPLRIKVGRCLYVGGYDKKPIIGLSWDSANGYYFPTHFKDTDEYRDSISIDFSERWDKFVAGGLKNDDKNKMIGDDNARAYLYYQTGR